MRQSVSSSIRFLLQPHPIHHVIRYLVECGEFSLLGNSTQWAWDVSLLQFHDPQGNDLLTSIGLTNYIQSGWGVFHSNFLQPSANPILIDLRKMLSTDLIRFFHFSPLIFKVK